MYHVKFPAVQLTAIFEIHLWKEFSEQKEKSVLTAKLKKPHKHFLILASKNELAKVT